MKKVLYVNNIANTAPSMVSALSEKYKVTLCCFPTREKGQSSIHLFAAQLLFSIKLIFKLSKFDILYVNYGYFGVISLFTFKPFFLHCHGTDLRNKKKNIFRFLTYLSLLRARKVFLSTPNLVEQLPKQFRDKSVFVPNVVLFNRVPAIITERTSKGSILVISKLDKSKGIDVIQTALKDIQELTDITQITYFNFGNLDDTLNLPCGGKFNPIGRVPYSEMVDLISSHDMIIGQVELGAIGMSELESMYLGKPTIANFTYHHFYDTPCPVVQAETSDEISTAVMKLLKNDQYYFSVSSHSQEWVANYHSIETLRNIYGEHIR